MLEDDITQSFRTLAWMMENRADGDSMREFAQGMVHLLGGKADITGFDDVTAVAYLLALFAGRQSQ